MCPVVLKHENRRYFFHINDLLLQNWVAVARFWNAHTGTFLFIVKFVANAVVYRETLKPKNYYNKIRST